LKEKREVSSSTEREQVREKGPCSSPTKKRETAHRFRKGGNLFASITQTRQHFFSKEKKRYRRGGGKKGKG